MYYYPTDNKTFNLHSDIRTYFPETSFPSEILDSDLIEFGVYPVRSVYPDYNDETQKLVAGPVVFENDEHVCTYTAVNLTPEELTARIKALVPHSITPRQLQLGLLAIGLLDDIEAAIEASTDRTLKINYTKALEFERNHPFVLQMAAALNKSEAEIDQLFILAGSL